MKKRNYLENSCHNILHMLNPFFCEINIDHKEGKAFSTRFLTTNKRVHPSTTLKIGEQWPWTFMPDEMPQIVARLLKMFGLINIIH